MAAVTWEGFLQHTSFGRFLNKRDLSLAANKTIALLYGAYSIGFAFIVGNIGTIIDAVMYVTGSVTGPVLAAFLLAALVPWCNRQGATAGMIVGYAICIMIAAGSLITNKKPINYPLPILVNECPEYLNVTLNVTETPISPWNKESSEFTDIFRISYILYTLIGLIISVVVAVPVSYFTGNHPVDDLDPMLVSPVVRKYVAANVKTPAIEKEQEAKQCEMKQNGLQEAPGYLN